MRPFFISRKRGCDRGRLLRFSLTLPLTRDKVRIAMVERAPNFSELTADRRRKDRRSGHERRSSDAPAEDYAGPERRVTTRRKVERRRQIDPTTCERDYSDEEIEFMKAMDLYKRRSGRQFPTWSEVLEVIRSLGYRQVAEPTEIELKT